MPQALRFLVYLLISWLVNAVILAVVAWIFTDVHSGTTAQLLTAAAVFGILNTILKPILKFVTFPLAILTLGLAWFGVSMLMLWITDALVKGFDVTGGFWSYFWATIVIWLLNAALDAGAYFWLRSSDGRSGAAAAIAR